MQAAARHRRQAHPLTLRVHQRSLARLLAVLALLIHGMAGLSPLWVGTVEGSGFEICAANGLRIIATDPAPPGTPADGDASAPYCLLCTLNSVVAVVPAAGALPSLYRGSTALGPADPGGPTREAFAGYDHLSRAPPLPA